MQKDLKVDGNQALKDSLLKGIEYEGIHFNDFCSHRDFIIFLALKGSPYSNNCYYYFKSKNCIFTNHNDHLFTLPN